MTESDRLPLDDLIPNETNAKGHAVEQIRASIRRFGFVTPMVIDARTGKLAEGHGRAEALQAERASGERAPAGIEVDKDGRWLVPVHREWASANDQEATAFLVAANRLVEVGGWDDQALLQALETARQTPTGLEGLGYTEPDISALLARIEAESRPVLQGDPDEVPEPPAEPVSKRGDVWLLGPHRVMCGDATVANDAGLLMDGRPGAILTDPPYGISANRMTLGAGKKEFERGGDWDAARVPVAWLLEVAPLVVIWGGGYYAHDLPVTSDWLCWHKNNDGRSFGEFELAWTNLGCQTRHLTHHWSGEEKAHPTQKPAAVMGWVLGLIDAPTIFDPFLGSGSTLIAAHQLGRTCYGMEIDPHYVDVICTRYEALTGDKPIRESTGEPVSFLGTD